jgi:hypothetical protein
VSSIESLILKSKGQLMPPASTPTHAGFHHRSINTTLLQQVKFRPVLPALNEIKITLMLGSVLIFSRLSCRLSFRIAPSSTDQLDLSSSPSLTSDKLDPLRLEERLDQIQKAGELREHDGLLLLPAALLNIIQKLKQLSDLG